MFQARKRTIRVRIGGPRIGQHIGDERAGAMLGHQIGAQEGLAEQYRDHPKRQEPRPAEANAGNRENGHGGEMQSRLEDELAARTRRHEIREGLAQRALVTRHAISRAPIGQCRSDAEDSRANRWALGCRKFGVMRRILGVAMMREVEEAEIARRQQQKKSAHLGGDRVQP